MKAHLRYAAYVLRHKWFVLLAGLRLGVPVWQLLVHDLSKFSPSEWGAYVDYFYGGPRLPFEEMGVYAKTHHFDATWKKSKEGVKEAFDRAWNHHQKANPHHWQYWILWKDDGTKKALPMPDRYVREMVADWQGAGRALGKPDTCAWYKANKGKMVLDEKTRYRVEGYLGYDDVWPYRPTPSPGGEEAA